MASTTMAYHGIEKGLWRNIQKPPYLQWVWTLSNVESVVALGLLMMVGAVAQNRAWNLVRKVTIRIMIPARSNREAKHLSQLS